MKRHMIQTGSIDLKFDDGTDIILYFVLYLRHARYMFTFATCLRFESTPSRQPTVDFRIIEIYRMNGNTINTLIV